MFALIVLGFTLQMSEKPIEFWIGELKSADPLHREEALAVLADLGASAKAAIPQVEKLLEDKSPHVRRRAAIALWKLGGPKKHAVLALAEEMRDQEPYLRYVNLQTLTTFGPDAAPAVPHVLALYESPDSNLRFRLTGFFQSVGKSAVPQLVEALGHKEPRLRARAAQLLADLGADAKPATETLTKLLDDKDALMRTRSAWALFQIGDRGERVLKPLVEGFHDEEPDVRAKMLASLLRLDPKPKEAAAIYKAALKERSPGIKVSAALGLWELEKNADLVAPALAEVLNERSDPQANWLVAVRLIRRMGPAAKATVPALVQRLIHGEYEDNAELSLALVAVGEAAVEPLLQHLSHPGVGRNPFGQPRVPNPIALEKAARVLGLIGKPSVDAALKHVNDVNPAVRATAYRALSACGPLAKPALKDLIGALVDATPIVRMYAADALGNIGKDAVESAPKLLALLENPDASLRLAAVEALTKLGVDAKTARSAAEKALADKDARVRAWGVELLWIADPRDKELTTKIGEALKDDVGRVAILPILMRMGGDAKGAAPALVEQLTVKNVNIVVEIVAVLENMGPAASEAAPGLVDIMRRKVFSGGFDYMLSALHAIGLKDKSAVPVLTELVPFTGSTPIKPHLYELLGSFKTDAAEAVKPLKAKYRFSTNAYERALIAQALAKIVPDDVKNEILPALREDMKSESKTVRSALALRRLDPDNKESLEALVKIVRTPTSFERFTAAESLGLIGPAAKDALPAIHELQAVMRNEPHVPLAAAVWRIGGKTDHVIPVLIDAVARGGINAQSAAAVLREIGPAAKDAVPVLLLARTQSNPTYRRIFDAALRKIDPTAARITVR